MIDRAGNVNTSSVVARTFAVRAVSCIAALVALSAALSACSSGGEQQKAVYVATGGAGLDTSQSVFAQMAGVPRTAPDSTPKRRAFDLCRILPQDTVARVLRATIGKSVTTSVTRAGGMCTYLNGASSAPTVRVLVDVGQDRSAATAGITFSATREQLGAHGVATTDIDGVGDAAYGTSDSAGSYTVTMQSGPVTGKVALTVRGASASSLRPAAAEIAKHTLAALTKQ